MIWIIGPFIPHLLSIIIVVYAITIPPFVFSTEVPSPATVIHEEIHGKQTVDTVLVVWPMLAALGVHLDSPVLAALAPVLALAFHLLVLYVGLWLIGCIILALRGVPLRKVGEKAYRASPMEREAYDSSRTSTPGGRRPNTVYLATRKPFAWVRWIPGAWQLESCS